MKDLKPLLSSDATEFERQLLAGASGERPSPELQFRMQQALGLAPVALHGADANDAGATTNAVRPEISDTHLAVKAGANQWLGGALLKAALGIGVGASLLAGGLALRSGETASQPTPTQALPPPVALPVAPAPHTEAAAPARKEAAAPAAEMSRELREEIERLDQVRAALAQGDARAAATLLDSYSARFPEGLLAREAGALRARTTQVARDTAR